ncbi:MAG: VOC family protein, partial [Thermoplasmata archaeon]
FEIPADDVEGMSKFYASLFDWKIAKTEVGVPKGMDYRLVETVPTDEQGLPIRNGVNGAIYGRQDEETKFTYYIQVESVEEYGRKVTDLGGKVVGDKTEVPEVGWVLFVTDPEGNPIGLFQPMLPE